MIVVIFGSRDADHENKVMAYTAALRKKIIQLKKHWGRDLLIIQGGCGGVDQMAGRIAQERGIAMAEVPANWTYYKRAAGPIRNRWMLMLRPEYAIGFHHDFAHSKGTKDMIQACKDATITCEEITVKV